MAQQHRPILLVEDDPNDVLLVQRAFRRGQIAAPLRVVQHITEAQEYLCGTGAYGDRAAHPLPILVLLDLKLPGGSGIELLAWIRAQAGFRYTPVIILSSSNERSDVDGAYEAGCNAYLVKPVAFDALQRLMGQFGRYWLGTNAPTGERRESRDPRPAELRYGDLIP